MDHPMRKHPRLKDYDYSQNGFYFLTLCTKDRACILGCVTPGNETRQAVVRLTETGKTVQKHIEEISQVYPDVRVDRYVIMPNHIHIILVIEHSGGLGSGRPTVPSIVHGLKVAITKALGCSIWQPSFYEHVIRGEESYAEICRYLDENPAKWAVEQEMEKQSVLEVKNL